MSNFFKPIQSTPATRKQKTTKTERLINMSRSATLALAILSASVHVFSPGNPAIAASPFAEVPPDAGLITNKSKLQDGTWPTWLLTSGDQFRLPAPPNRAATLAEIKALKAMAGQRDAATLNQIAFWNTGAPAYRWNELFITEALKRNMNTLVANRALALLNAAIYDATVAAWDSKEVYNRRRPSEVDPSIKTVLPNPASPSYPSEQAVTAGAASAVLAYLFPDDAQRFSDMAAQAGQVFVLAGVNYRSDVQAGLDLGRQVGQLAVSRGKADGSDAKWTGAVPAEAGKWTGENPALPLLGTWKTWVLSSGSELRPPPPPAFDSPQMQAELKELQVFTRTPKSNADAFFWEFAAGGLRNYAYWNDQLSLMLFEYDLADNPLRAAQAYAMMNIAIHDAAVACWDAKYTYWGIRPFQLDPAFKPLFTTPNHPSYPSAHSCLSSAAVETLAYLFPQDADTFASLAQQAGESRIWAGLHFRSDIEAGEAMGRAVAQKVIARQK